jgi:uncharacterized membrane protein YhhN
MRALSHNLCFSFTLMACAVLVITRLQGYELAPALAKMAASAGFLVVAITSGAFQSRYGKTLFFGLCLAAVGDMLLIGSSQSFFLFGLGTFLLAHVVYLFAFIGRGISARWALTAAVPVAITAVVISTWLLPQVSGTMQIPVLAYTVVISLMVVAAFGTRGAGASLLIPVGALLFYFSDLAVATDQFVQTDFPNYVWGLPLYYTGQLLLARSTSKPG